MSQKKSNSQIEYTKRKCYVCGEVHGKDTICPQILKTMNKISSNHMVSNFWGVVFVQCFKQKKNFLQLICEICELTEGFLGNPYYYQTQNGRDHLSISLCEYFSHNIDLTLEYCAAFIGCQISDFFMKDDVLFDEFSVILSDMTKAYEDVKSVNYDDESYSISMECRIYNFFEHLPDCMAKAFYDPRHLRLNLNKEVDGDVIRYNLFLILPKVIGNYFHAFIDYESSSHKVIPLYYDFQEKFKELYEKHSEIDDELTRKFECSDGKFAYWKKHIITACQNHRVIWKCINYNTRQTYSAIYKDIKITFATNQNKEFYDLKICRNGLTFEFFADLSEDENSFNAMNTIFKEIHRSWKETSLNLEQKDIGYSDVIISSNSLSCKTHSLIAYRGLVHILTPDFKEEIYELYVSYCQNCGTYRALTADYEELLKHGKPLCKVYSNDKELKTDKENTFTYKSQSILHIMGYTVKADSELTEEERRNILVTAIQNKLISSNETIGFLNWLVDTRKGRRGYAMAVKKWTSDILFLKELTKDDRETIEVDTLYV